MATISISIDKTTQVLLDKFSAEDNVSKSVLIRTLVKQAAREREWLRMQAVIQRQARRLGLDGKSIDELEEYLG